EPLRQLVAADPEIDRLRVLLHVGERQLIERRRRCVLEREGAEDGGAGLVAGAAGGVMNPASAEAEVMAAVRPRQCVGQLQLAAEKIGEARLSNREWCRAGTCIGC